MVMVEGGWKVKRRWSEGGQKVVGKWLKVVGRWLKVVGRWLKVVEGGRRWSKVVGRWLEVVEGGRKVVLGP